MKIEEKLSLEKGTLALLQTYFAINDERSKANQNTSDLTLLRKSLFWDTDLSKIDWQKQSTTGIKHFYWRKYRKHDKARCILYGYLYSTSN